MFNSPVPLIFLRFPEPLQRENKEKHFLIKVHWIKKQKKKTEHHRDTTLQPLSGLENNLNHHFKWAVCDPEIGERHFNLSVSLESVKICWAGAGVCVCVCVCVSAVCVFLLSVNECLR